MVYIYGLRSKNNLPNEPIEQIYKNTHYWTDEDDQIIRDNYNRPIDDWRNLLPHRTDISIVARAKKLGYKLFKVPKLTKREIRRSIAAKKKERREQKQEENKKRREEKEKRRAERKNRPIRNAQQRAVDRFWKWANRRGDNDCWEWSGTINNNGYGTFTANGKSNRAHRFSWELHNGPIPPGDGYHGTCVRHKCDNRCCVNPNHLELGTHIDNMRDKWERGRAVGPHKLSDFV